MKKGILPSIVSIVAGATFLMGSLALAGNRTIAPIVSTQWLAANSGSPNLVIVDVRSAKDYQTGHLPGSVSAPFGFPVSAWITIRNKLFLEVPDTAKLFQTIGGLGIRPNSRVVIVSAPDPKLPAPYYGLANGTRVAVTLIYAGVPNVAILDGGFPKWKAEKRPVSLKTATPKPVTFKGAVDTRIFVSLAYVRRHLKSANIIDARDADVYFGAVVEPWTKKAGHIPGASSLPAPWIWQRNKGGYYTFKDRKTLAAMAAGVAKRGKKGTIVYCGVGGYASSWWFVLTQVLKQRHVKFFDGAAQEWGRHYNMVPYRWE
jgi:thiosulfate/3-mercaptopyruvate sulfurtransferase